jgi:serine/threonine-protein kinase
MFEAADLLGRTVAGKFELEAHVGGGAMGHVFRARHTSLGTTVAIKIMKGEVAKDPMFRHRFLREAKAASRLEHPCSVRVLDYGEEPDGLCYLAMEFLNGKDLLRVLATEWPLSNERVVRILVQVLGALSVAHGRGIVHRDLKPENIMISTELDDDGRVVDNVKVCDFGIAKLQDPRSFQTDGKSLTSSGMLIGTPEYMSPEQARGDPLDPRTDLYSIGVVLYHMLTGRVPFTAENTIGVVLKQVTDEPEPPSKVRPGVDARLEAICLRAMRKNRDERYATAKEMRAELRALFGTEAESGARLPPVRPGRPDGPGRESGRALVESAPTLEGSVAAPAQGDFGPKPSSGGGELALPVTSGRTLAAILGGCAGVLIAGGALAFLATRATGGEGAGGASSGARPSGLVAEPGSTTGAGPAESAVLGEGAGAGAGSGAALDPHAAQPVGSPSANALRPAEHPGHNRPRGGQSSSTAAIPATPAPASAPSAHAPPSPAGPAAHASPPAGPSATVAPGPSAVPASSAPYRPSAANVTLGTLTTERVDRATVSARMSQIVPKLTECYRFELVALGAPLAGTAQIALSIDEQGAIQPIVTAARHPQFARCAQQALAGQRVPKSAVEAGGGTASQWLTLNP